MSAASEDPNIDLEPRVPENLDLRGLVCSIIHEYRETALTANHSVTFVDEHPYAIVFGNRLSASVALRLILECIARATPEPVIVVRIYATDEELCVDLSDSAIGPRAAHENDRNAGHGDALLEPALTPDEFEFARHRLEQSGAMLRVHRADAARVFTIAFERAAG